jgi:peptidoglycan/LPS O-acetylase OafA/YrhL
MVKLVIAIYLSFWVAVAAAAAYFGPAGGVPSWLAAGLALITFIFVTGSLAYLFEARQLGREGKTPPRYVDFMFSPWSLHQPVRFPAPIRIALGLIVIFGGVLFVFAGGTFVVHVDRTGIWVVGAVFLLLGLAFLYVGYRVIRMNRPERRLFGPDRAMQPPAQEGSAPGCARSEPSRSPSSSSWSRED